MGKSRWASSGNTSVNQIKNKLSEQDEAQIYMFMKRNNINMCKPPGIFKKTP